MPPAWRPPAMAAAFSSTETWKPPRVGLWLWRRRHGAAATLSRCHRRNASVGAAVAHDHQPIAARLAAPHLARTAIELADAGAALVARIGLEFLGGRIEALEGIVGPVGRPHDVLVVDIDRVGAGGALRHRIDLPGFARGVVAADAARGPEAHPQHALGVRPDTPRSGALARRIDHHDGAGRLVDLADVIAGKRSEPHVAVRRRGD